MKELLHDDDMREEGREEGLEKGLERGIRGFILDKLEDGVEKEIIIRKLRKVYGLSEKEAETRMEECRGCLSGKDA